MRNLEMEREVHGHPPSVIFADRAEVYAVDIPAIPTPAGMSAPTPNTGEAYIRRQSDGTPELKRSINFTAASIDEDAGTEPITMVRSANPDYVSDQLWRKLHAWVHNWILQRIPEDHQHLVGGVKKGGVKGLLVKVFGLAARSTRSPAVLQGSEANDEDGKIDDGNVRFGSTPMDVGPI
jgi:hypothetical protein